MLLKIEYLKAHFYHFTFETARSILKVYLLGSTMRKYTMHQVIARKVANAKLSYM